MIKEKVTCLCKYLAEKEKNTSPTMEKKKKIGKGQHKKIFVCFSAVKRGSQLRDAQPATDCLSRSL